MVERATIKAFGKLLVQLQKLTFEQTKKVETYFHTKPPFKRLD